MITKKGDDAELFRRLLKELERDEIQLVDNIWHECFAYSKQGGLHWQPIPAAELPRKPTPEQIQGYEAVEIGVLSKGDKYFNAVIVTALENFNPVKSALVWKLRKVEPVVKWWKHGKNGDDLCKTIDGIIVETHGQWYVSNNSKLTCEVCLQNPISESEYLAATQPEPVYPGLNPEKLSADVLAKMPKGARLLECEDERLAFASANVGYSDLFNYANGWETGCFGNGEADTYCTTRPIGWWRKPVALTLEERVAKLEDKVDAIVRREERKG